MKARAVNARRRLQETSFAEMSPPDPHPDPLAEVTARELLTVLDEELQRLPAVYRLPLILCCLEGRSQEEAARQLGWTAGSLKGRLERGRARLHARLAQRGFTLAAVLAPTALVAVWAWRCWGRTLPARGRAALLVTAVPAVIAFAAAAVHVSAAPPCSGAHFKRSGLFCEITGD